MKRIVILLLVVIAPIKAFCQLSSGSIVAGGELAFTLSNDKTKQGSSTDDGPTKTYFSLIPNVEYFLADNFSAGIGLGYRLNGSKSESGSTETISRKGLIVFEPYLKKYFPLGDRAYFYGQCIASFGFGKQTTKTKFNSTTVTVEENSSSFSIGAVPGLRFDVSEKVGLEAGFGFLGFSQDVEKSKNGNTDVREITNTFEFRFIPNALTLGIRYTIN